MIRLPLDIFRDISHQTVRVFVAAILGVMIWPVLTYTPLLEAQSSQNSTSPVVQRIDNQASLVQIKQLSESELRARITELKKENETLDNDILELRKQREELLIKIQSLEDLKRNRNLNNPEPAAGEVPVVQNLDPEINRGREELFEVEKQLAQKLGQQQANNNFLAEAEQTLAQKTQEIQTEVSNLQSEVFALVSRITIYALLIFGYLAFSQIVYWASEKYIQQEVLRKGVRFLAVVLTIGATITTIVIAFIGNLSYLLTGMGVFSAALVVALQDFVSSFFAWIWIKVRSLYRMRDVIQINSNQGKISGVVTEIGVFRTTMKELVGQEDLNAERQTGRTVSFPNNLILKEPLTNFTKDNRILWHNMNITITFESNADLAKQLLDEVCTKQFNFALDHKDQYLDDAYNLKYLYRPRVYMDIATSGPRFTIWFAARYGHYREILEGFSTGILKNFRTHGIDLAYTTTRVIPTPIPGATPDHITFHDYPGIALK